MILYNRDLQTYIFIYNILLILLFRAFQNSVCYVQRTIVITIQISITTFLFWQKSNTLILFSLNRALEQITFNKHTIYDLKNYCDFSALAHFLTPLFLTVHDSIHSWFSPVPHSNECSLDKVGLECAPASHYYGLLRTYSL